MAGASRREKLEAMLKSEPDDAFLRYGLAGEYDNEGRIDEAVALYRGLMADSPPHVPSFFRCAQLFVREDRIAEARTLLRDVTGEVRGNAPRHAGATISGSRHDAAQSIVDGTDVAYSTVVTCPPKRGRAASMAAANAAGSGSEAITVWWLDQETSGSTSKLRSTAGAEWVRAPTETTSAPVVASSGTRASVTPPETSRRARPATRSTACRMS